MCHITFLPLRPFTLERQREKEETEQMRERDRKRERDRERERESKEIQGEGCETSNDSIAGNGRIMV